MEIFESQINTYGNFININFNQTINHLLMEICKRSYIAAAGIIRTDKQTKAMAKPEHW